MLYLPEKSKILKVTFLFSHLFCLWKREWAETLSFLISFNENGIKKSLNNYVWPKDNLVTLLGEAERAVVNKLLGGFTSFWSLLFYGILKESIAIFCLFLPLNACIAFIKKKKQTKKSDSHIIPSCKNLIITEIGSVLLKCSFISRIKTSYQFRKIFFFRERIL